MPAPVTRAAHRARARHGAGATRMPLHGYPVLHKARVPMRAVTDVFLLTAGADPNSRGKHAVTPLHVAVLHGHTGILKLCAGRRRGPKQRQ